MVPGLEQGTLKAARMGPAPFLAAGSESRAPQRPPALAWARWALLASLLWNLSDLRW